MSRWVVMKFGGTSVASPDRWRTIGSLVQQRLDDGERPVLVCSALSGITNVLERMLAALSQGDDAAPLVDEVERRHLDFAARMGLDGAALLGDLLDDLRQLVHGATLIGEVTPRLRARIGSAGELLATRIGAAWLSTQGLPTRWLDARELLTAMPQPAHLSPDRHFLAARCGLQREPELQAQLDQLPEQVLLTQGYVASDDQGETVLLGRGGSDTSASLLAARLGAERVEIWTDVPGMFTCDPRQVSDARLLRRLDYAEAQELAILGAKVLHPRCIPPVAEHGIPLHVRCTPSPELPGTCLEPQVVAGPAQVKAVATRRGLHILTLEPDERWDCSESFLLADTVGVLKRHGVGVDHVAVSEINVTVVIDPADQALTADTLSSVLEELERIGRPRLRNHAASVSLVGTRIRKVLGRLGPILEGFEEHAVHLVSQAANDLNLTFIVDEDDAEDLAGRFHERMLEQGGHSGTFGPSWRHLVALQTAPLPPRPPRPLAPSLAAEVSP